MIAPRTSRQAHFEPAPAQPSKETVPVVSTAAADHASESLAAHLRRIAAAAAWSISPVVAGLLLFGKLRLALSVAGGALVSVMVFAVLRVIVTKTISAMSAGSDARPDGANPGAMAQFAFATLLKFVGALGLVYLMVRLGVNLLALLAGFVIAQTAIAVSVARSVKGPV